MASSCSAYWSADQSAHGDGLSKAARPVQDLHNLKLAAKGPRRIRDTLSSVQGHRDGTMIGAGETTRCREAQDRRLFSCFCSPRLEPLCRTTPGPWCRSSSLHANLSRRSTTVHDGAGHGTSNSVRCFGRSTSDTAAPSSFAQPRLRVGRTPSLVGYTEVYSWNLDSTLPCSCLTLLILNPLTRLSYHAKALYGSMTSRCVEFPLPELSPPVPPARLVSPVSSSSYVLCSSSNMYGLYAVRDSYG